MLDIKFIRENSKKVKEACSKKQVKVDVDAFLQLDKEVRNLQQEIDALREEKNKLGKEGQEKGREIKEKLKVLEDNFNNVHQERSVMYNKIPNVPYDDVPVGKSDLENVVLRKVGKLPKFNFPVKEHFQIGEDLNIIDIQRASKIAGSRFYFLKNEAVVLEMALINFVFAKLVKKGFAPIIPPVMIKPELATAMGYIENPGDQKGDEESYYLERDKLYLTATSEQSLGAMHAGETFMEKELPKKYVAFSSCFRRESGSYGKDTKGIFRVHQFDKMEMFVFCKPEESETYHQELLSMEEELMKDLQIAYQVMNICTGDLGKPAAKKYDIEAWMPGQQRYRETHSTSNCSDYQARGLEVRYKNTKGELNFVHTLNGTAFALGRIIIAILENNQQKDGSVKIPKVLQKYTGFKIIKARKSLK
jgi:seryl-tRNA synthetase